MITIKHHAHTLIEYEPGIQITLMPNCRDRSEHRTIINRHLTLHQLPIVLFRKNKLTLIKINDRVELFKPGMKILL